MNRVRSGFTEFLSELQDQGLPRMASNQELCTSTLSTCSSSHVCLVVFRFPRVGLHKYYKGQEAKDNYHY